VDVDAPLRRRGLSRASHLPAVVGYAVITVALTWPLAVSLNAVVASDLGDPLLSAAILWWNAHHLPFSSTWWNGQFFFPSSDTLALSDHRIGLGIFATPLIQLGASPVAAYNVTFLMTWWLSALAAYALTWTLTANRAAAFLAGCVFGFNPFRAGHLAHLELLAAYCLPIVLLALHRWRDTRAPRWLVLLSAALFLQALSSGYFFFYMAVFIGLWLVWFGGAATLREYAMLAAALAAPLAAIAPVLLRYRRAHDVMGLARSIDEIQRFSADLTGLVTPAAPLSLWNFLDGWRRTEGELMPGVVAIALILAAALFIRTRVAPAGAPTRVVVIARRILAAGAVVGVGAAVVPAFTGALSFAVGGVDVSISSLDKPLSIAFICGVLWLITSRSVAAARRSGSMFAFYSLAAVAMWVLAMGPQVRLLGRAVLYRAPYSWLMWLPGFENSFRAPARFAMLAALALSVAAALALGRLGSRWPLFSRPGIAVALAVGVLAESWIFPFPVAPSPARFDIPAGVPASAAVLELPTGIYEDALATFHTTEHDHRVINGLSGYNPPHYTILSRALTEGDPAGVAILRRYADIVVFSRRDHPGAATLTSLLRETPRAVALPATAVNDVTLLPSQPAPATEDDRQTVEEETPAAIDVTPAVHPSGALIDDDYETGWSSRGPQRGMETMTLSAAEPGMLTGVRLSLGRRVASFPRGLAIDVSEDGVNWARAAEADGSAAAIEAALAEPRRVDVTIRFEPRHARLVRITQTGWAEDPWAVVEVRLLKK
jgi:F5/8 type C domain-containing protein